MGIPSSLKDAFGRVVLCRRCNGRGVLDVAVKRQGGQRDTESRPCPRCDGRGVVDLAAGGLGL